MKMKLLLFICSFFALNYFLPAQVVWEQTNGPYGGSRFDIVIDNLGTIYAMPYSVLPNYPPYLKYFEKIIYYSKDKGKSWKSKPIDTVTCMAIDENNQLLAAIKNRIYFYDNNFNLIKVSSELPKVFTRDESIEQILMTKNGYLFVNFDGDSLFLSTDKGSSWQVIAKYFNKAAIDSNKTIIYIKGGKIYRSDNYGLTSEEILVADSVKSDNIRNIEYVKKYDRFIATGYKGISYLSDDKGLTWRKGKDSIPAGDIYTLASDRKGNIFLTDTSCVYRSNDGGDTWSQLDGFKNYYYINSFAFDKDNNIIASDWHNGLLYSDDSGKTVKELNVPIIRTSIKEVKIHPNGDIYAIHGDPPSSYLFRSTDSGNSWEHIILPYPYNHNINSFLILKSGEILISSAKALFQYSDEKNEWKMIDTDSLILRITSMSELDDGKIVAILFYYGGIFISQDTCKSWFKLKKDYDGFEKIMVNKKGWILAGGYPDPGQCIILSKDYGFTWKSYYPNNDGTLNIAMNDNFVFAVNSFHWYYLDREDFFCFDSNLVLQHNLDFNNGWNNFDYFRPLIKAGNFNEIYLCHRFNLMRSLDNGIKWDTINHGMEDIKVLDLCFGNNHDVYAGTLRNGVYKCTNYVGVENIEKVIKDKKLSISPNPTNSKSIISYSLDKPSSVSLSLQSILGEIVIQLEKDVYKEAGSYSVELNTSELPSGVYFCTLKAGSIISTEKIMVVK
jgi:photosystem II stability/assembly factor-like uncharacterized protein